MVTFSGLFWWPSRTNHFWKICLPIKDHKTWTLSNFIKPDLKKVFWLFLLTQFYPKRFFPVLMFPLCPPPPTIPGCKAKSKKHWGWFIIKLYSTFFVLCQISEMLFSIFFPPSLPQYGGGVGSVGCVGVGGGMRKKAPFFLVFDDNCYSRATLILLLFRNKKPLKLNFYVPFYVTFMF